MSIRKVKHPRKHRQTLADLVAGVTQLTQDGRLSALVIADLINTGQVRFTGKGFNGRRVVVG